MPTLPVASEMPEMLKVKTRLKMSSTMIWPPLWIRPRRSSTSSAPSTPKIAPEAPAVNAFGVSQSAPAEPASPEAR